MSNSGIPALSRTVARPVANLGNTCYMNAVLQALVHAPDLCLAMDCEPHQIHCPIAAENAAKLRAASPSSSQHEDANSPNASRKTGTRKSRRSGRKSPPDQDQDESDGLKFCALCEVEEHFRHVHDDSKRDSPVAPSAFVNGFIKNVAVGFKLGVQEDSHEFLRLLIDSMQKSCQQARTNPAPDSGKKKKKKQGDPKETESEYSFSLFRGMVESNVTCDFCQASSSTLDPIEDVGLEVTLPSQSTHAATNTTSSRNNSPTPAPALADVQTAFTRFARAEALDAGYKCEKCGKVGRATKQSRLANIPPILTLHLKRFRYGDSRVVPDNVGRRTGRSEVNQLLGNGSDFLAGKSGSAKIEGHVKFEQVVNLKPYLTEELQKQHASMFCRLFAVIVHAGKNSHSGHYIAYVRSLAKNEWWKMDDGRVTHASDEEVMGAEAYMLFYRVVQHPVTLALKEKYKQKFQQAKSDSASAVVAESSSSKTANVATGNRKRPATDFANGEDWARAKTNLPPHLMGLITKAQALVAEEIQLTPAFYKYIADEASKETASVGNKGPAGNMCEDDVVGGTGTLRRKLCDLFYRLASRFDNESGGPFWLSSAGSDKNKDGEKTRVAVVEEEEEDLL